MFKFFARRALKRFSDHYSFDVSYLHYMLEYSPSAFFKFSKIADLAKHSESAPANATSAAALVGAVVEDCGPCTQLTVNMAMEAGVDHKQIEAVLTRNVFAMEADTALAFRFADAVVRRAPEMDEMRDAIRAQWGEKGVIDLTLHLQLARLYPMVKAGFGYAKSCQRVEIEDSPVDVVKEAA